MGSVLAAAYNESTAACVSAGTILNWHKPVKEETV
jgi:hypothetical protein